jgi:predicted RecB family nuclease
VCREELEEAGDITLLPDITPRVAFHHREVGVNTVTELARLHRPTAELVDAGVDTAAVLAAARSTGTAVPVAELARPRHSELRVAHGYLTSEDVSALDELTASYSTTKVRNLGRAIDQARVHRSQRVHRARGVAHVEIPRAAVELDVDIEDDSGGICYLIGVRETIRARGEVKTRYVPFVTWENTTEAEGQVFAQFWQYMMGWQEKARSGHLGGFRAYYYTEHESRYFRHLAKAHAGEPGVPTLDEVEEFLASDAWLDMHPIVGKQLVWPVENRTLKSLAKYVKFFWRDETPGGANSVAWYREAIESAESDPERAEELRQRLLEYNEDDVDATFALREWVSRLGEARRPGTKLPEVSELDKKYDRRPAKVS